MVKPVTEELGALVIQAVAAFDQAIQQAPRAGVSMTLPELSGVTVASDTAASVVQNSKSNDPSLGR